MLDLTKYSNIIFADESADDAVRVARPIYVHASIAFQPTSYFQVVENLKKLRNKNGNSALELKGNKLLGNAPSVLEYLFRGLSEDQYSVCINVMELALQDYKYAGFMFCKTFEPLHPHFGSSDTGWFILDSLMRYVPPSVVRDFRVNSNEPGKAVRAWNEFGKHLNDVKQPDLEAFSWMINLLTERPSDLKMTVDPDRDRMMRWEFQNIEKYFDDFWDTGVDTLVIHDKLHGVEKHSAALLEYGKLLKPHIDFRFANSKNYCGIQIADLLAWCTRREISSPSDEALRGWRSDHAAKGFKFIDAKRENFLLRDRERRRGLRLFQTIINGLIARQKIQRRKAARAAFTEATESNDDAFYPSR